MKLGFIVCLLLVARLTSGQYIEKKWFDKTDSIYGFYLNIPPQSGRVQGALILLDAYGANAEGMLADTKIHNVAWANDILTICIPTGPRFYANKTMIGLLNKILTEVAQNYKLKKDQFAIGGMASGGTIALRFTEMCNQHPDQFPVQPKAVFAIDATVDLVGLIRSSENELKKNNKPWWLYETQMIVDKLKSDLGNPDKDLAKYNEVSPMIREAKDSLNEKALKNTAVRTYHDADINWYAQNRQRSLYETTMPDASELISRLVSAGNKQAEFVVSKIPGRRSNGEYHPHSWNIVDEIDLVQWIKKCLNFYPDHLSTPFLYTIPAGWETETILFPMDFAADLPYKGFEELRFAPGWGDANSGEKWAYTILWWLDGNYQFDEEAIRQNLQSYYTGLTGRRAVADSLNMKQFTPAIVQVTKAKTAKGDVKTFTASASVFDAQVTRKPGRLYFKVHLKECNDKARTIVLFEVAASPFDQPVWQQLGRINEEFKCVK